jgi:hypothetical protein
MSLHIGFSTRVTLEPDEEVDFDGPDEPMEEEGDEFDSENASNFSSYGHYPIVSKHLPAVEALICHPLVVPLSEARPADVEQGQEFAPKGLDEWTAQNHWRPFRRDLYRNAV